MNPNQPGCYLIHWQPAIGNLSNPRGTASHYLGSTKKPVGDRFNEHQTKVGARITKAAVEQGTGVGASKDLAWRAHQGKETQEAAQQPLALPYLQSAPWWQTP